MPTKTKKSKKRVSMKQTVKQSVVVNVNSKPKTSKKTPVNVKSLTKGNSYLGSTLSKMSQFPMSNHNIYIQPAPAMFSSDIVNRVSALENMRKSQITDQQQAQSVVLPLATQTPTANLPINEQPPVSTLPTPTNNPTFDDLTPPTAEKNYKEYDTTAKELSFDNQDTEPMKLQPRQSQQEKKPSTKDRELDRLNEEHAQLLLKAGKFPRKYPYTTVGHAQRGIKLEMQKLAMKSKSPKKK